MSDDVYRSRKRSPGEEQPGTVNEPVPNPMERVRQMQEAMAAETGREPQMPPATAMPGAEAPFQMSGNVPEAFRQVMASRGTPDSPPNNPQPPPGRRPRAPELRVTPGTGGGSEALEELLAKLADQSVWEEVDLPSKGRFYESIPPTLHLRPMTGEEEQILATPRHVRRGKAIDMIFDKCIREPINPSELLSEDRTFLLIYLRGISYTPEYDVEITCPECRTAFQSVIDLDGDITVTDCPEDFGPDSLSGTLPTSGFPYKYRLPTGEDEQAVTKYRASRLQNFDESDDDTLLYRTGLLLERIGNVTERHELHILLKRLPINDLAHLRNLINDPPFGVKTEVGVVCQACSHEFKIELPMDADFFFPRKKGPTARA